MMMIMEFKEKFDEIVRKMMDENPDDFEFDVEDKPWHRNYAIARMLQEYVVNWPWIATKEKFRDGDEYLEVEEVDTENIEMDVFEDYVHIAAGGDWQYGTDFDLVLNENIKTKEEFPFLACNIRYMSDINGNDLDNGVDEEEGEGEDDDDEEYNSQEFFPRT